VAFEDVKSDILIGFARLRIPSENAHRPEMENAAIIRELRTVSQQLPISARGESWQHRGFGEKLINRCVELASDSGREKILVTSGVGVREYYRKLGWERDGPYMGRKV
jgi:elongator complex protein 3